MTWKLTTVFSNWRCPQFLSDLAVRLNVSPSSLSICFYRQGSVVVEVESSDATYSSIVRSGQAPADVGGLIIISLFLFSSLFSLIQVSQLKA